LVGWLEFNVPFQDKYSYIRDEVTVGTYIAPLLVDRGRITKQISMFPLSEHRLKQECFEFSVK